MANTNDIANALEKLGATVDRANFATKMQDPDFAERVRTSLEGAGASVPDSSTFYNKYGVDRVALAKDQYAQDVAAQKQQAIEEYNRANPITSTLFPRSSIDAATGDRGVVGSLYDAFADVSSMPGRAVARVVSGENEIDAQEHPYLAKAHEIAKNVATDPLLIPSIAVGGPIASGLAKTSLTGAKLIGAGIAAGAGLNTALGAVGRAGSQDQTVKAFDPTAMAYDAAFGAGGEVLGTTAMGIGRWLKAKGTGKLGSEVVDALTAEERMRLARALQATGDIPTPRGARAYTRDVTEAERKAMAEYAGKVLAQDPLKPSFADPNKGGREGGLFGSGRKALASNLETRATSAGHDVSDMFTYLDQEFQSTLMKNDAYARSYEPIGMDESGKMIYQNPKNPIEFAVEQDLSHRGINPSNSVDIAFDNFRNKPGIKNVSDVTERAARLKSDLELLGGEGYVSPSQANAWANDLLEEAKALRASKSGKTQVAEFLENTANQVNRRLEDMGRSAGKATPEKMVPIYGDEEGNFLIGAEFIPELHGKTFQQIGEVPEVQFPYKETVARKEALGQISQGARRIGSPAEGIDPWKFIAAPKLAVAQTLGGKYLPPSKALALGSEIEASGSATVGDLASGLAPFARRVKSALKKAPDSYQVGEETGFEHLVDAGTSRNARVATPSRARVAVNQVGNMVAETPLASGIARAAYQHLQNRRDLTEMEYKNIRSILGVPEKSRTPEQVAYLKKFGY
jgi:hypothetical protein